MTIGKLLNLSTATFSFVNEMMVMISAASQEELGDPRRTKVCNSF